MKKKLIFSIVAAATASLCFSISAFAQRDGLWEYELLNNEVTITGYYGSEVTVTIPPEILGTPVTKVEGEGIFAKATTVKFPGTVKTINHVFKHSDVLKYVELAEGTEVIADGAFKGCTSLRSITMPSTVKAIGNGAFENCMQLTEITIPSGLQYGWDESAFKNSGVTSIDLSGLTNVKTGSFSFKDCKALTDVKLYPGITWLAEGMFAGCSSLKNISIPNTITLIPKETFSGCTRLEYVIMPTSLKVIETDAFKNCDSLAEIIVPYGTQRIASAFVSCDKLESLYMPDTVTDLSQWFMQDSKKAIVYCSDSSTTAALCKSWGISYLTDASVNSGITVLYNGKRVSFQNYGQNPEIVNDSTLVPLRAIFEAMSAGVTWNDTTKTVLATRGTVNISLAIGDYTLYKNGEAIKLEVPAQLINDRTMVPVRVIAESFGANVQWDGNGRTVIITETAK